jgi:hypothetical protein
MKTALQREVLIKRNTKHNLSQDENGNTTRLYSIWCRMKQRCFYVNSLDYKFYGGRGITVCVDWRNDYKKFHDWAIANGYDKNLTIERTDNYGDYCPDNCKWTTRTEQSRNKRNNHKISFNGQTKTLAEWSEILGIESSLLRYRLKHWSIKKAFTLPVRRSCS